MIPPVVMNPMTAAEMTGIPGISPMGSVGLGQYPHPMDMGMIDVPSPMMHDAQVVAEGRNALPSGAIGTLDLVHTSVRLSLVMLCPRFFLTNISGPTYNFSCVVEKTRTHNRL